MEIVIVGLIILIAFQMIISSRERMELVRICKANSLSEYEMTKPVPEEEVEEPQEQGWVGIDDISIDEVRQINDK